MLSAIAVLLSRMEVLKNWKVMTEGLLSDEAVEARSSAATINLVQLLREAAHRAAGGSLSQGHAK